MFIRRSWALCVAPSGPARRKTPAAYTVLWTEKRGLNVGFTPAQTAMCRRSSNPKPQAPEKFQSWEFENSLELGSWCLEFLLHRHRLREVARFVDVAVSFDRDVIA